MKFCRGIETRLVSVTSRSPPACQNGRQRHHHPRQPKPRWPSGLRLPPQSAPSGHLLQGARSQPFDEWSHLTRTSSLASAPCCPPTPRECPQRPPPAPLPPPIPAKELRLGQASSQNTSVRTEICRRRREIPLSVHLLEHALTGSPSCWLLPCPQHPSGGDEAEH